MGKHQETIRSDNAKMEIGDLRFPSAEAGIVLQWKEWPSVVRALAERIATYLGWLSPSKGITRSENKCRAWWQSDS